MVSWSARNWTVEASVLIDDRLGYVQRYGLAVCLVYCSVAWRTSNGGEEGVNVVKTRKAGFQGAETGRALYTILSRRFSSPSDSRSGALVTGKEP